MTLGYFPGCSLHATAREYDDSLRGVLGALGVELEEVRDWACCGATSAHATNHLLSVALAARTLALAEEQRLSRLLAPCAACYNRLASARNALAESPPLAEQVTTILGRPLHNSVPVVSILELLRELLPQVREHVTLPLAELRVACYYGCLLVRPPAVTGFDDAECPTSMEAVVEATGAKPVRWSMALECCGGGFSLSRTASVVRLGRAILEDAHAAGAQVMVVACPMCHSNLDFRQRAIAQRSAQPLQLPILFLSQLVGLALGLEPRGLGLGRHFVSPLPLLEARAQRSLPPHQEQS